MKMALKVTKEAPTPSKAEAKAKALKAKKAVLKAIHSHKIKKRSARYHPPMAKDTAAPKAAEVSLEEHL